MIVVLNGDRRQLRDGARVVDAVAASGASQSGRGVAVAIDGDVLPRLQWDAVILREGQRIEVVQAVQGG